MTDQDKESSCQDCASGSLLCGGPAGHGLIDAVRAIPITPQELADLLGIDINQLDASAWEMRRVLRDLPLSLLAYLMRQARYPLAEAVAVLVDGAPPASRPSRPTAVSSVTAMLMWHAPRECRVDDLAAALNLSMPALHTALTELRDNPPPGTWLHDGEEGHLTLRAAPDHLCPDPYATEDTDSETSASLHLTPVHVAALWVICRGEALDGFAASVLTDLAEAGILRTDTTPPQLSADAAYSLQWWPATSEPFPEPQQNGPGDTSAEADGVT